MATDEFGGIAIDEPKPRTDQFGGIAIGDAPTPSPPISGHETFLPNLVSDDAKPFVNSTTTGGIMKAFGHEFGQAFGGEQLGLSPEGTKWLSKIGIFAPEGQDKYQNPFQAFNEGVLVNTAAYLDGAIRTANAAYRGMQGAGVELGHELSGGTLERGLNAIGLGSPEQLARDVVSIPDALMGSPHPTGMFKQPSLGEMVKRIEVQPSLSDWSKENNARISRALETMPEDARNNVVKLAGEADEIQANAPDGKLTPEQQSRLSEIRDEVKGHLADGGYEEPPQSTADSALTDAKDLGIIGEEKPRLADLSDKPVPEVVDTLRPKQDGAPEAIPAQDGGWRDRFDHYVGKLTQPEEIRQLIRDSADENNNFPGARAPAGPLSLSEAQNLADAAGMDLGEVDRAKLGKQFNEAHVDRAMQVMIQSTRNVKDAARDVITDASEENLIKFQEHLLRRDMAVEEIVGIRSTWGRIGNTLNKYVTDVKDGKALDSFIKETCPL